MMVVLIGLLGYGLYDIHQSKIIEQNHRWQQEQEKKDVIAKCSNEAVDQSVAVAKKVQDKVDGMDTSSGDDGMVKLLMDVYVPIVFATTYKGDDGYSYQTYQDNYSICMQSHGVDFSYTQ